MRRPSSRSASVGALQHLAQDQERLSAVNSWGMPLHPKADRENRRADQAADQRECAAPRGTGLDQGSARNARAYRDRPAVEARKGHRCVGDRQGRECLMGPGEVFSLLIVVLIPTALMPTRSSGSSRSARSSLRSRRASPPRKRPNMPPACPSLSSECGCSSRSSPTAARKPPPRSKRCGPRHR